MNKDQKRRDEIIFGKRKASELKYVGGCEWFEDLSVDKLKLLIEEDFADERDSQNYSPTIKEMIDFADCFPNVEIMFDGYVVSSDRKDYRTSINAITIYFKETGLTKENIELINFVRDADEFTLADHYVHGWWD